MKNDKKDKIRKDIAKKKELIMFNLFKLNKIIIFLILIVFSFVKKNNYYFKA